MASDKLDSKQTYNKFAADLQEDLAHDDAMAVGVGGEFENIGAILADLVQFCGLQPNQFLIYVGCGSGRLAKPLAKYLKGSYLGIAVVPDFLTHAKETAGRSDWQFQEAEGLRIPAPAESADMVFFFNVMTHLLRERKSPLLRRSIPSAQARWTDCCFFSRIPNSQSLGSIQ